jgi:beta-N-acetylhexosaminidase
MARLDGRAITYPEAAALALSAGCDLVLLCNQSADGGEAIDGLLAGLTEQRAQGHWSADADGEVRRLALLPLTPPLTWDELMHHGAYQHALERLP